MQIVSHIIRHFKISLPLFSLLHDLKTQRHLEKNFGRSNRSNVLWPGTFVSFDWLRSNFKWFWFEGYLHVTVKIMIIMIKQAVSFNSALSLFMPKFLLLFVCLLSTVRDPASSPDYQGTKGRQYNSAFTV